MRDISPINESLGTLLTEKQAAEYLGVTPRYLQYKRANGDGPPYIRLSHRCVRYQQKVLDTYYLKKIEGHHNR
jgi:hypothetical protein